MAVEEVPREETMHYGVVAPADIEDDVMRVVRMVEKPRPEEAPSNMAIAARYVLFHLLTGPHAGSSPFAPTLADGVIGAMAGYLCLWLVYHAFRLITGKEGMGYGDFKLFAALLAWLGYQMFLPILLLSAATGAMTGITLIALGRHGRKEPIPFGPYLAAAGFVALAWGEPLLTAVPFLRVFR